ncbi:DUF4167 domain-containing protein [Pararhodobacter marinus]|uniref:DUF4167 domain-containing protein n=1 Tax=Pararhodobacter marinus TaxID=2184063 RepID=UPI003512E097
MRTSNKRSRSKQNRPRSLGNIVNRVFDSSGPEGKVRGTPQQIIDKYTVLARDAQLSGDRVAAENFQQHAEHYTRMLNEAQAELAREAEARRDQQNNNGNNNNNNRRNDQRGDQSDQDGDNRQDNRPDNRQDGGRQDGGRQDNNRQDNGRQESGRGRNRRSDDRRGGPRDQNDPRDDNRRDDAQAGAQDAAQDDDSGSMLVETPESRADHDAPKTDSAEAQASGTPDAGAAAQGDEKPKPARKPRAPRARKPKADAAPDMAESSSEDTPNAAE